MKRIIPLILILVLALVVSLPVGAQMMDDAPTVEAFDQLVLDGVVNIFHVVSDGPGFVVIHADNGEGSIGAVIGYQQVFGGSSFDIKVPIDASAATSTVYAMLHSDTGEVGEYEFGMVEGADGPVANDDGVIAPALNLTVINTQDQFVSDNSVTIPSVTTQEDGWLVVHADNGEGSFGAVLGAAQVAAGTTADVSVTLEGDVTNTLWPMLHVDTGAMGEYEFGMVEGADGPVVINESVAVTSFATVPTMRIANQIVDDTVVVASVLAEVDGFVVIHTEADGGPGPVAGFAAVSAGLNTNVVVEVDAMMVTSRLWPMLHVDTGAAGEYEFGTVEGADGPVFVNDSVLTFPINAAPSLVLEDQAITSAMMGIEPHIFIKEALIDAPGWLVIHSSVDGSPGPVIGVSQLAPGLSQNVVVQIDDMAAGEQVFPMLHYDTGAMGEYEFGTVDGADSPVAVDGNVIVAPMALTDMGGI
ncbi:MAG: hypothetical protein Q9P01_10790 [Anaerolineae bacterium]|nr:hypothetical protein [Anaerolineae bacterium]MDQ7035290.1 hypothetical protein [Anaerolineae bacterium]